MNPAKTRHPSAPSRALILAAALAMLVLVPALGAHAARASSLRYFGYFAARLTAAGGNHLPEVSGRSNLNWVQISDPDRYAPEVLDSCAPGGCVVSTGNEFFRGCDSAHSPSCELYPNYVERWERLADAVRSRIGKVGAFYLLDEPQFRGATVAELETAARTIKRTFPGVPVMMVEAEPQIGPSLQVPAAVDWVGFDWYCHAFSEVESTLATLTSRIGPAQSLFMVMESAPLKECGDSKGHATDAEIAALQYAYLHLANSNPRVIGLLAFGFWTSGHDSADLPLTVTAHEHIWSQIRHSTPSPPPPSHGPAARILGKRLTVRRRGPLTVALRCPRANLSACSGRVSLRLVGPKRKRRLIGASRFSIEPGRRVKVAVKVGRRMRGSLRRLARHGRGRVRVNAVTAAGKSSRVLSLRLKKAAGRHAEPV